MNLQDETFYKLFLEKTHYGLVFKVDLPSFRVIAVGDRFLELSGLKRDALELLTLEEMPHQLLHPATKQIFQDMLANGQPAMIDTFLHSTAEPNKQLAVGIEITPLFDESGKVAYLLYKICENAMELMKNDFISMVSHELKTPLTSLKAYVQLLNMKAKQGNNLFAVKTLNKVDAQVNKMNKMIRSFLDLSRLESGKVFLDTEVFIIDALLAEIVEEIGITDKTHTILFSACKPLKVNADREKIGQVINNLLSNAIKYSPMHSKVTIRCEKVSDEVIVSVFDEGIGLAKKDIANVFSRFYRVRNAQVKTVSGFGIGLYISAEIIKKHGGDIWVESEEGKGSVFHFSLPARE